MIPLNEECGLLEWVQNTHGLRNILSKIYKYVLVLSCLFVFTVFQLSVFVIIPHQGSIIDNYWTKLSRIIVICQWRADQINYLRQPKAVAKN